MATSTNEEAQNVSVNSEIKKKMADKESPIYFANSSHRYAIGDYGLIAIIGWFVILLQMALYVICLNLAIGDTEEWLVPLKVRGGKRCTDTDNLVCVPEYPSAIYHGFAAIILAFFLMRDVIISFFVICKDYKGKHVPGMIAAFLICINGILGIVAGLILIATTINPYGAFTGMIGVILISFMDKKAYETCEEIDTENKGLKIGVIVLFVLIIFGAGIAAGATMNGVREDDIVEIYGSDYWDARFSSGGYTYTWPDTSSDLDWDQWGVSSPTSSSGGSPTSSGGGGQTPSPFMR